MPCVEASPKEQLDFLLLDDRENLLTNQFDGGNRIPFN